MIYHFEKHTLNIPPFYLFTQKKQFGIAATALGICTTFEEASKIKHEHHELALHSDCLRPPVPVLLLVLLLLSLSHCAPKSRAAENPWQKRSTNSH